MEAFALCALGAFIVGLGKGGLFGVGMLTIAIYAQVFQGKSFVGVLLIVLVCADVMAVAVYRRHAQWARLRRLLPWTVLGIVLGWATMDWFSDAWFQPLIGGLLLAMTALHFWRRAQQRRSGSLEDRLPQALWFQGAIGTGVGFVSMISNGAGPLGQFYMLSARLPKLHFIGTMAWLFFLVNLLKIPFQAQLGLITLDSFRLSLSLGLFAVAGVIVAPRIVSRINQKWFEAIVIFFILVSSVKLLLS